MAGFDGVEFGGFEEEGAALVQLLEQVDRLQSRLGALYLAYVDLVAACRAGIVASTVGHPDPWSWVRAQMPASPPSPPRADPGPPDSARW